MLGSEWNDLLFTKAWKLFVIILFMISIFDKVFTPACSQTIDDSRSILKTFLESQQANPSYNAYMNISYSKGIDLVEYASIIDASIRLDLSAYRGDDDFYVQSTQISARLGTLSTKAIGAIMPQSVLELKENQYPAVISQSAITGNFQLMQIADTVSTYAFHGDNFNSAESVSDFVGNISTNSSSLVSNMNIKIRGMKAALREGTTYGIGAALNGRIVHFSSELENSILMHD